MQVELASAASVTAIPVARRVSPTAIVAAMDEPNLVPV